MVNVPEWIPCEVCGAEHAGDGPTPCGGRKCNYYTKAQAAALDAACRRYIYAHEVAPGGPDEVMVVLDIVNTVQAICHIDERK